MCVAIHRISSSLAYFYPGLHKYSTTIYDACILSFQALPVTALIDQKFFCVHGGISPELEVLSDINRVRHRAYHLLIP